MEKDEVSDKLNELMASRKIVDSSIGPLWFIYPTLSDKVFVRHLFKKRLKELKAQSIMTVEESLAYHISIGEWSKENEEKLVKLPEFIEETKKNIYDEKNRVKRKKFESWLSSLTSTYENLINAKNTILVNSAEYLANSYSILYIIWKSFRHLDETLIFKTFEEMESSTHLKLINELTDIYYVCNADIEEKEMRQIAKNSMWRIKWSSARESIEGLFGREIKDLSNDQFMLVYWSKVYDSVYDSLERPPDAIVENDEDLDNWLKEENEKREREIGQRYYGKSKTKSGSSKIDKANEVFKVVDGYFDKDGNYIQYSEEDRWKEIERVRSLNAPVSRAIKKREEEKLKQTPGLFIQEHELRKKKEDREFMGGNVTVKRKG